MYAPCRYSEVRHQLSRPGPRTCDEGRAHRRRQRHARRVVAHSAALKRRRLTGAGQQVRQARSCPERRDVVGRPVGVRPPLAVAGDQAVHQAGIARRHRLEVQTRALQRGGTHIGEENVCAAEQFECGRPSVVGRQVEQDAALAAVVHFERRADPVFDAEHAAEHPRRIARRRLDLDDVSTPVGEYPACRWTCHPYAEFDDVDALHRSGHWHPFRNALQITANL